MRCVREDMFAQTITVHYLTDGNCTMKFIYHKQEFLIPVYIMLKAMCEVTDAQIYNRLVKGYFKNRQIGDQVEVLIGDGAKYQLYSQNQCLGYIGSRFRMVLDGVQQDMTDIEVGRFLIERLILVHVPDFTDKFQTMCLMLEKLYAVVAGECECDSLDAVSNQEVLLGGHLYGQLLADKLYDLLIGAKAKVIKDVRNPKFDMATLRSPQYLKRLIDSQTSIGKKLEHFLATGNLISRSNLDLQQTAGFTVVADKLNMVRYLSHFRSIHRGQYFTEMKTTTVRKLLPEQWGFVCPVHTPDGAPCGLLNHISLSCVPLPIEEMNMQKEAGKVKKLLTQLGMSPISSDFGLIFPQNYLPVMLDGKLLGYIDPKIANHFVNQLRAIKVKDNSGNELYQCIPKSLEIAFMPSMHTVTDNESQAT